MVSPRTGTPVANQYVITSYNDDGSMVEYFQSYNSIVVKVDYKANKTYLDKNTWDYSRTTSKYRNEFLNTTTPETKEKIKSGEFKLADLN